MANLTQNQNQTFQTAMLAQTTMDPQPDTVPAQIKPTSTAAVICAGQAVKLVAAVGPNIIVDVCTGPTDGPVFGVIPYNQKKNTYVAGDTVEVVCGGGILMLKSSAAINRGDKVAVTTNVVSTNDPTVATDAVSAHYITGIALGQCAAADALIKIKISPSQNP